MILYDLMVRFDIRTRRFVCGVMYERPGEGARIAYVYAADDGDLYPSLARLCAYVREGAPPCPR